MIAHWSAQEIRQRIAAGDVSAREVCEAAFAQIARADGEVKAFLTLAPERALTQAARIDARPELRQRPLAGVPIAVKDNLCTRGLPTTAGSKILEGYLPPYDATAVARLEAAGAIVVGKTNCDEFAMGSSNENSAYFPTRNPWDLSRAPGGSSGGSAAAVAARMVPIALGSDTGGSVRQPAAFCGVVGLKPTYGRVSRYGLLAFGSSLDQIGPLTRSAHDAALVLGVMAGRDPHDATSSDSPVDDYVSRLDSSVSGLRIGVPRDLVDRGGDADVRERFEAALATLVELGATLVDVLLPHAEYAIPVYYLVATAEASSNLARYDGVRYGVRPTLDREDGLAELYDRTREAGFGPEVKRRIMLGTYVLSAGYYDAYYLRAQRVRTLIRQDYEQALRSVDTVVMPTSPSTAFGLGERVNDPLQMYLADIFTVSANLAGLPALSVPCGVGGASRMPVGLQLVGAPFEEGRLLAIAAAYERATNWTRELPAIATTA